MLEKTLGLPGTGTHPCDSVVLAIIDPPRIVMGESFVPSIGIAGPVIFRSKPVISPSVSRPPRIPIPDKVEISILVRI